MTKQEVVAFDGRAMQVHNSFDMRGTVQDKDGKDKSKLTLTNLNHVPNSRYNLFSANQAVNQGWEVHVNRNRALVSKGQQILTFDRLIRTGSSQLYAMRLVPEGTQVEVVNMSVPESHGLQNTDNEHEKNNEKDSSEKRSQDLCVRATVETAVESTSQKARKITRQMAHYLFGHMYLRDAIASAKLIGAYDVIPGGVVMCEPCLVAKSKRKNINKKGGHVLSNKPNGRIYLDITTIKEVGKIKLTKGVWKEVTDEFSKCSTTLFMQKKSDMPTLMARLLSHWKAIGKPVEFIRCDNAGENKQLEETTKRPMYQLGISFEYTARATPEQNSRVEKSIDTKYNRTRACLDFAHIPAPIKRLLIRECITQVTHAVNLRLHEANGVTATSYEHFFDTAPLYAPHLHVFGEAAVVHTKTVASKKMDNRGKLMMFVGNSPQHFGNVCRLFDADTTRVVVSRDVKFVDKL